MKDRKEVLTSWLNDAYAMEKALVPVLENHAKDAEHQPDVRERDLQHAEETKRHATMVEQCLERLGEKPSRTKSVLGKMMGEMQAVSTGMFKDEVVKNFIADYAAEHFEIASYRSLVAAARELGEEEIARTCEEILKDEERMAGWLEENMPRAVSMAMGEAAAGRR